MNSALPHSATRSALRCVLLLLVAVFAVIIAGCSSQPDTGPAVVAGETPRGFALFPTNTPSPTATRTATATPTATPIATPTPTPTATPPAASAAGRAPVGRIVFGVTRADEPAEQLWLLDGAGALVDLADSVTLGAWTCNGEQPATCALVTTDGFLLAAHPISQTSALLDQLAVTGVLSPTVAGADGPLALSADGRSLAVVLPDRLDLYNLDAPALFASIAVTDVTELAWSPDGEMLALVYPAGDASALALWNRGDGRLRVVAQMDGVQHAAWSPDGDKIAFDAFRSPATPSSQGNRSDVFVVFLKSGEIANFSEVFLNNAGVAAASQVAAWSPHWESADVLRYVRGVPDAPDAQSVWVHPVRSRKASKLWPVAAEGLFGVIRSPDRALDARAIVADEGIVIQIAPIENHDWSDMPGVYDHLNGLAWAPIADGSDALRYLLLAQDQGLLAVEVAGGAIQGLARACPDCVITRAVWLP